MYNITKEDDWTETVFNQVSMDKWNTVIKNKRGRNINKKVQFEDANNIVVAGPQPVLPYLDGINNLTIEQERHIAGVNNLKGEWEVIQVTLDSGAVDTVTPPSTAKYFPIFETEGSKRGLHYRAANGTRITNHGARNVRGISADFKPMNMIMNVADVKKTLASAYQIVDAGNTVVLDREYSYIVDKLTGEKTTVKVENGEFIFDLWVPAPNNPDMPPIKVKDGIYAALTEEEEEENQDNTHTPVGFIRQEILP